MAGNAVVGLWRVLFSVHNVNRCVYTVSEYISMLSGSDTKALLPTTEL